jgi:flagellar motor protein MotB
MRELITLVVCLVLFLLAMQSGLIRTGMDYQTIKQDNQNLQSTNEQLTKEIKRLKSLGASPEASVSTQTVVTLQKVDQLREDLERRLSREIRGREVVLEQDAEDTRLVILDKLLFAEQSDRILPSGRSLLLRVARALDSATDTEIRVTGHSSRQTLSAAALKKYPTLRDLSVARASAVVRLFTSEGELDPVQLLTGGFGDSRPVVPNDTDYHRALNGRIEISLHWTDAAKLTQARDIVRTESLLPGKDRGSSAGKGEVDEGPIGRESLDENDDNAFDAGYEAPAR